MVDMVKDFLNSLVDTVVEMAEERANHTINTNTVTDVETHANDQQNLTEGAAASTSAGPVEQVAAAPSTINSHELQTILNTNHRDKENVPDNPLHETGVKDGGRTAEKRIYNILKEANSNLKQVHASITSETVSETT